MSMPPPTITLPRLEGESARAYAARTAYLTLGPQRSYARVGQTLGKSRVLIERWASQYAWADHARRYDELLAQLAAQQAAQQYLADLEEHRERYGKAGMALHGVAVEMLLQLRQNAAAIDYTPAALATIARALTVAADLEAHALRLGDLLPRLSAGAESER